MFSKKIFFIKNILIFHSTLVLNPTNMKKIILLLLLFIFCKLSAQTTAIPDPVFEQALITFGIDSDGIINGQALTSDLQSVTELILDPSNGNSLYITSLSGIEAFSNLQELTIPSQK